MKLRFSFLFGVLILSCIASHAHAEEPTPVYPEIETSIDRVEAKVGDVFTITVGLVYDSNLQIIRPAIGTRVDTFEVQDFIWADEVILEDRRRASGYTLKLWALDTGSFQIPPLAIKFTNQSGDTAELSSTAYQVSVLTNLESEADTAALAPLREALENPLGLTEIWYKRWQFWAAIGLLALGLAAWIWKSRKEVGEAELIDTRPAWEKAFDRLATLRNAPYLANSEYKTYYSELTNILKEFVGKVTDVPALDMTTDELLNYAANQAPITGGRADLRAILIQADLVKFAKYSPDTQRAAQDFELTYTLVQDTRDEIKERERLEQERQRELAAQKQKSTENSEDSTAKSTTKEVKSV